MIVHSDDAEEKDLINSQYNENLFPSISKTLKFAMNYFRYSHSEWIKMLDAKFNGRLSIHTKLYCSFYLHHKEYHAIIEGIGHSLFL